MNVSRLALVLSASLLTAVEAAAQRLTEVEPNNTPATAMAAPFGAQIDASLTPGDHDWYSFTVAASSSVKLFTSPLTPTSVDTVLTLFDASGTVVIDEDDNQRGIYSDITLGLTAGSYLVRVRGASTGVVGAYSLDLGASAPVPFTISEGPEPNGGPSGATPFSCGDQVGGQLGTGDSDWYQFVVPGVPGSQDRSGVVIAVLKDKDPPLKAFAWRLLDVNGGVLSPTSVHEPMQGTGTAGTFSLRRCMQPGTYHVAIDHSSSTGTYRLDCAVLPMNTGVPQNEPATTFAPGDWGLGSLANAGEADVWGPIPLFVSSGYLMVQLRPNGATGQLTHSAIQLLDGSGVPFPGAFNEPQPPIAGGNHLDDSNHARGTWRLEGNIDSVFVRVSAPGNQTGGYRLEVGLCGSQSTSTFVDGAGLQSRRPGSATCLGSNGLGLHLGARSFHEVPVLGTLFCRHVEFALPNTPVVLIQGYSDAFGSFGPLPFDFSPFGGFGCSLHVDPLALTGYVSDGAGVAEFLQATPPILSLGGAVVYEQVVALDLAANPLGATFSNSIMQRLGDRSW